MPSPHSEMMRKIFSTRTSPASSTSKAHLGTNPQALTTKAMARSRGRYSGSKGQVMNTWPSYPWGSSSGPWDGNDLRFRRGLFRFQCLHDGASPLRFGNATFLRLGTQGHVHIADFDLDAVPIGHVNTL